MYVHVCVGINDNNICRNEIWKTHLQRRWNHLFLLFRGCVNSGSPPFSCSYQKNLRCNYRFGRQIPPARAAGTFISLPLS